MTDSFRFSDLVQAAGDAFMLFPKATYDAVVQNAEAGTNSNGDRCIKAYFKVTSGPYAATQATIRNQFNIQPSNPKSLSFFFQHMEALGLPKDWFNHNPSTEQVAAAMVGRQCRIVVDDSREYQGRKQNDVTDVLPPATGVTGFAPAQAQYPQQYGIPQGLPAAPMIPSPDQQFGGGGSAATFANAGYSPQTQLPQAPAPQFAPTAQPFPGQPPVAGPPAPPAPQAPVPPQPPVAAPPAPPAYQQPAMPQQPAPAPQAPPGVTPFPLPGQPQQQPQQPQQPAPPPPAMPTAPPAFQPPAYQPPPQQPGQAPPPPDQTGLPF